MNMKKVLFPLVMLFAMTTAFADRGEPEVDWNNPDEVGNVWVCLDKEGEGIQVQGEWECQHSTWFTVDMVPVSSVDFEADPLQVDVLVDLFDEYNGTYKIASYVKGGKKFAVKNRNIYLYKLPSDNFKLVARQTEDVLASQVLFKTYKTKKASYLIVLPRLDKEVAGGVDLRLEDGKVKANAVFSNQANDKTAVDLVVMESADPLTAAQKAERTKRQVAAAMQKA